MRRIRYTSWHDSHGSWAYKKCEQTLRGKKGREWGKESYLEDEDTNREQEVDTRGRAVDDPEDEPAHANQEEELLLLHPREGDEGEEDESAPEI